MVIAGAESSDPRKRLRAIGLTQRVIAGLLGRSEHWVSQHIAEDQAPASIRSLVIVWQELAPSERGELLLRKGLNRPGAKMQDNRPAA